METQARYEFRVWAVSLQPICQKLELGAKPAEIRSSSETYIISRATSRANLKIRAGTLDLKRLLGEEQQLERWSPVIKDSFPIAASTLSEKFFPCLGLEPLQFRKKRYTMMEFLNDLVRPHHDLAAVKVFKKRAIFNLDRTIAEFARLRLEGRAIETVAVESIFPEAVHKILEQLDLNGCPNVNYIRQIKRMIGMKPPQP